MTGNHEDYDKSVRAKFAHTDSIGSSILAAFFNIGGYTMIEIKEALVIKSDSPKVAEWVKRMKAYKAALLQDMAKRGVEVCDQARRA